MDGEKSTCSPVLTQIISVTNRQTDRRKEWPYIAYIELAWRLAVKYWVAHKNVPNFLP